MTILAAFLDAYTYVADGPWLITAPRSTSSTIVSPKIAACGRM